VSSDLVNKDVLLGEIAAQSEITLNIHVHRCVTFKNFRVIETLQYGVCLLTENCFGMYEVVSNNCIRVSPYGKILQNAIESLQSKE